MSLDKVLVSLADARPELVWNQLTGGSNSMHAIYTPVRVAAAIARGALLQAAAEELGGLPGDFGIVGDLVKAPSGRAIPIGSLAQKAATTNTHAVTATLKPQSALTLVGTPQRRIDATEIVTGRKKFAMDLHIPNALPTMVCRPPTINGSARSVRNLAQVTAMPGITDVAVIPHTPHVAGGVAVRGQTFGQCIDAIDALDVEWAPGPVDGKSEQDVLADLKRAELPLTPALPLAKTIEKTFTFHFRPGDPLETNCAIADVRSDRAEIWSCLKSPVWAQEQLASILGLPVSAVTTHVTQGGGSFGRHLFSDAAFEAAAISQAMGKPVKLMWHRTDNFRQGRVHPMCTSRVRVTYTPTNVLAFDQRHTSVATDFSMGLGELLSATLASLPAANLLGYSQAIFTLTQNVPYNFGPVTQLLNEVYAYNTFNTGSVRNIYSPNVTTAIELMVDELGLQVGKDPYALRRSFVRDDRLKAVLDKVAAAGDWGRAMAPGTAQGIAIHSEYKSRGACLIEIDCRPATVTSSRAAGTTRTTRASGTRPLTSRSSSCHRRPGAPAAPANSESHRRWQPRPAPTPAPPAPCRRRSRSTTTGHSGSHRIRRCRRSPSPRPTHSRSRRRSQTMPTRTFILNGKRVTVDCEDDVRLLWVLRDLLGVTGPKYGCGLDVCKACTSHINGKASNPCSGAHQLQS